MSKHAKELIKNKNLPEWLIKYPSMFPDAKKDYDPVTYLKDLNEEEIRLLSEFLVLKPYKPNGFTSQILVSAINPDTKEIEEYSRLFNKWLTKKNNTNRKNIDYISTDPGPGHKKKEGQLTVAQDVDDTVVLDMIPKIGCICLSDETIKLTRTLFIIANFNNKIKKITIFKNNSVKEAIKDKKHFENIKVRDVSYCKKKLSELLKQKIL